MHPREIGTQMLAEGWQRMTRTERNIIGQMHDHFVEQFRQHRDSDNQEGLAHTINGLVDEAVERGKAAQPALAAQVKCKRGCSACCYQNVSITLPEAHLLVIAAEESGGVDWDRVLRQAEYPGLAGWRKMPPDLRACVFLGAEGECRVYEHRPTACRKHMVITDPADCDTIARPGTQVGQFVSQEAEVLASAALWALPWGSMPRMLLRARVRERVQGAAHG